MTEVVDGWMPLAWLGSQQSIVWMTGPAFGVFLGRKGHKKGVAFDFELGMFVDGVTHFRMLERPADLDPKVWKKAWDKFEERVLKGE